MAGQLTPALRKRGKPDASTASLHDPTSPVRSKQAGGLVGSSAHRSSKATLAAGTELLSRSAPMPFSKMARNAPPVMLEAPSDEEPRAEPTATAIVASASSERRDPFWFIRMLRTELSDHEFAYMNVANTDGTIWDPYDLKIVAFNEVDPDDHYTISEAGVTHCKRYGKQEVAEFTPLEQWEEECGLFHEVMEIPFFKRYQSWKAYTSWRRAIKTDKFSHCSQVLTSHLFILNDTFQPSLLKVRALCVELSQLKLHQIKSGSLYSLEQFVHGQQLHKQATCEQLDVFFDAVKDAVQGACDAALDKFEAEVAGATPAGEGAAGGGQVATPRKEAGKRSFLQQAQLRSVCKKITNYIRVVDYIVLSTLHQLLMSSLADLQYLFDSVTPGYVPPRTDEDEEQEEEEDFLSKGTEKKEEKSQCLFSVDIEFQAPDSIEFSPSGHEFAQRIDATISDFVNMLKTVGTLITHEAFKRYTQPIINGRQDTVEINEGFDIVGLIEDNEDYNSVVDGIKNSFDAHFDEVILYVKVLEPHKKIYLENETLDMASHAEDTLEEWRELIDMFTEQTNMFKAIPLSATVGIFGANNSRIKDLFLPNPQRCLDDIHATLPQIAAASCKALLAETSHATERLARNPEDVAEFVEYSTFLATTNERQKEFSERGNLINSMYALMNEYHVSVPDNDNASVRMMESSNGQVSHLVAQSQEKQEERTNNFTTDIDAKIEALRTKASELRQESENPILFDGKTEMNDALELIGTLMETFDAIKADSIMYEQYQEILKVPVTRYDEVETVEVNMRLKKNMWQGLNDWGIQVEEWKAADFETLNPEDMGVKVGKYNKIVGQCDKGLPTNTVLPLLADKVTTFKAMTPVVVALRNAALKAHHWEQIETAIHTTIDRGDGFNLGYLLELKVNEYREEIETISTAATQENVLEEMLAKVENAWRDNEFVVNSYKESKDVFILGGVDDVMAILEETQVLVQTILGSRFVGPMQKRVDEWEKKLRLFSETLDEWLAVQRAWMYLESIFKAADIQRQLPNEFKDFEKINKMWLELMKKTNADPSALKQATAPKLKENLEKANATLDRIQKNLEDYLETKRNAFPRFFFVSAATVS